MRLHSGDLIVAFTDGVTEALDTEDREFGERALRAVCEEASTQGPEAVRKAAQEALLAHVGNDGRPHVRRPTDAVADSRLSDTDRGFAHRWANLESAEPHG